MKNSPTTKLEFVRIDAAFAAVYVVATILFYVITIRPILGRQETTASQTKTLQSQRRNTSQLARRAANLTERLDESRAALEESPLQLKPVSTLNQRIARLTSMARAEGLMVDRVEQSEVIYAKKYNKVGITLTGSSGYRQWARFLNALAQNMPDVVVDSFELVGTPQRSDVPTFFRIDLIWYASPSGALAKK